jgi:AcrR family transcriptional regulator
MLERSAMAIADERGLDAVTMTSVATHLGVRPPSLYGHVKDRTALLDRLSVYALARLADDLAAALAGRSGREALAAFADAHRRFALRSPGLWLALQRPLPPEIVAVSEGRRISQLAAATLRAYPVPDGDMVHAIRFLGATVNGFLALERSGGFTHSAPGPDSSWTQALRALDALFSTWPAADTTTAAAEGGSR